MRFGVELVVQVAGHDYLEKKKIPYPCLWRALEVFFRLPVYINLGITSR